MNPYLPCELCGNAFSKRRLRFGDIALCDKCFLEEVEAIERDKKELERLGL